MLPVTGQLPTTEGAIYTVPTGQRARVVLVNVYNAHTAPIIVQIKVKTGGNTSGLTPETGLDVNHALREEELVLHLREGDSLRGVSNVASVAQYLIAGEESPL